MIALGIKNFGLASVLPKLIKFSFFHKFFSNLAKFLNLDVFFLFDFSDLKNFLDFLVYSTLFLLIPNLSTLIVLLFLLETNLLLSFLLEVDLLPLFLLKADLSNNLMIFNIEINGAAILLKL